MLVRDQFLSSRQEECPVCKRLVIQVVYSYRSGDTYADLYRCGGCGLIFVRPLLLGDLDMRQMDGIGNAEMYDRAFLKRLYANLFVKREVERVKKVIGGHDLRLLDVGCGTGWMTRLYADHGFQVVGLEPSDARASVAAETYGIDVIRDFLETAEFSKEFDVVVMRHIIEHFAEPNLAIKKVRESLSDSGLVLVTVPNSDSLGRWLFGVNWSWALPHHCNFFTLKSMRVLLEDAGFKVLRITQSPSPFYFPNSFVRKFPNKWLAERIASNRSLAMIAFSPLAVLGCLIGRGDNLNVIAQRK